MFVNNGKAPIDTPNKYHVEKNEDDKEIQHDRHILAYIPMYIKGHSQGEFIFDHSWADYAYEHDIEYYPKLLVGIPFTPVTGSRILLDPKKVEYFWNHYTKEVSANIVSEKDRSTHDEANEKKEKNLFEEDSVSDTKTIMNSFHQMIGRFLKQVVDSNRFSSIHLNFLTEEEASSFAGSLPNYSIPAIQENMIQVKEKKSNSGIIEVLLDEDKKERKHKKDPVIPTKSEPNFDFLRRTSIQYHWSNVHPTYEDVFESFDEYLESMFKSKKRINIKRERSKIHKDENIMIDVIKGRDILKYDGLVEQMYEIYVSTVNKMYWGNKYLSLKFFQQLCYESEFVDYLCFVCAREGGETETRNKAFEASDVFAGTFNVIKDGVFYGRYWGCLKEVKYLHFEVCYWSAIEYCIQNGLKRMEPGAGGGDYKWARGFDATLVHSVHYVKETGLRDVIKEFLLYETEEDMETAEYLKARRLGHIK